VAALLEAERIAFAVVGATAMAVHGVSRSTRDVDLLALDARCLASTTWAKLQARGVAVTLRVGGADDPLAGVVRLTADGESPVDVVVGKVAWQSSVLERATRRAIGDVTVPVAAPADLVLLKLYAGGPQDAWDIAQLLDAGDRAVLVAQVQGALPALPEDSRRLWSRVVDPR
jgi:Nucleotidyl transferase of unknown function (DUF2204)